MSEPIALVPLALIDLSDDTTSTVSAVSVPLQLGSSELSVAEQLTPSRLTRESTMATLPSENLAPVAVTPRRATRETAKALAAEPTEPVLLPPAASTDKSVRNMKSQTAVSSRRLTGSPTKAKAKPPAKNSKKVAAEVLPDLGAGTAAVTATFDAVGSKELARLLHKVTGLSAELGIASGKLSAITTTVAALDARVGSEDELNGVIRRIEYALEDVKKVGESRAVGLDIAVKGLGGRMDEGLDWAEGGLTRLSVATNEARELANVAVTSLGSARAGFSAADTAIIARADAEHDVLVALQTMVAALELRLDRAERALPSAVSMLQPRAPPNSGPPLSTPQAPRAAPLPSQTPQAPRAAPLPSQASQAPRAIYDRPADLQRGRGNVEYHNNLTYKRPRSPLPPGDYPMKKRNVDVPAARAPSRPPSAPAAASLPPVPVLAPVASGAPVPIVAPALAPGAATGIIGGAVMMGPIPITDSQLSPEELVDWVLTLLPDSSYDFAAHIVSRAREGLHVRVNMTSARIADRLVAQWDADNPVAGTSEMLTVRLATKRDDAFTRLFCSGN